jgi:hypothetical protein
MPADLPIPDKSEWQKLKSQYKVPAAVGKAKVGEHLDKIHKAAAISWFQTIAPSQQALVALKGYKAALTATKDPVLAKFVGVVDNRSRTKSNRTSSGLRRRGSKCWMLPRWPRNAARRSRWQSP